MNEWPDVVRGSITEVRVGLYLEGGTGFLKWLLFILVAMVKSTHHVAELPGFRP